MDINDKGSSQGCPPLVHGITAFTTSPETIRHLLNMGADWKSQVRCGGQDMSLLTLASRLGRWEVAEILLSCGASSFPEGELQPFAAALRGTAQQKWNTAGCQRFLGKLVEAGVTPPSTITVELSSWKTETGPLLSELVRSKQYDVLKHLLHLGVGHLPKADRTAWSSICSHNDPRYLALLLEQGVEAPLEYLEETRTHLNEVWNEPDAQKLHQLVERYPDLAGTLKVLVHQVSTKKPSHAAAELLQHVPRALIELGRTKGNQLKNKDILARMRDEFRITKPRRVRKVMDDWWLERKVERIWKEDSLH
ncbi:hypothetical protein PG985_004923 [Apiospora marii]|uniref:uncharacterized protein n=1 Tax=Apiospora marii TaxID=335849 RepID=UPI003131A048